MPPVATIGYLGTLSLAGAGGYSGMGGGGNSPFGGSYPLPFPKSVLPCKELLEWDRDRREV